MNRIYGGILLNPGAQLYSLLFQLLRGGEGEREGGKGRERTQREELLLKQLLAPLVYLNFSSTAIRIYVDKNAYTDKEKISLW